MMEMVLFDKRDRRDLSTRIGELSERVDKLLAQVRGNEVLADMPPPLRARVSKAARSIGTMDPGGHRSAPTLKELVWEEFEAQAEATYEGMDPGQATVEFGTTDDGKKLLEWYNLPDASLPIVEWIEHRREQLMKRREYQAKYGVDTAGEAVAELAKRAGGDYGEALNGVAREHPQLFADYRAERR